jgi:hypothetical protein
MRRFLAFAAPKTRNGIFTEQSSFQVSAEGATILNQTTCDSSLKMREVTMRQSFPGKEEKDSRRREFAQ